MSAVRLQFSMKMLMVIVVVAALGCAALRFESSWWPGALLTFTVLVVLVVTLNLLLHALRKMVCPCGSTPRGSFNGVESLGTRRMGKRRC